jgi:hypothetical protein
VGVDSAAYAAGQGRDSSEHAGTLRRARDSRISLSTASIRLWMILWITRRSGSRQSEELEAAGAGEEVLEDDVVEDVEDVDEEDPDRESVR